MAANYDLNEPVEKRVRFFDGQFLQAQDFVDEQRYHLDRARRHNRLLHLSGIVDGLSVTSTGANQVTVTPGTAIDSDGRQLVLAKATPVSLEEYNDQQGIRLYLRYRELEVDEQAETGGKGNTRWLESPELVVLAPGEGLSGAMPPVLLARLSLDNKGGVTVDDNGRQHSGLRLPGPVDDAPAVLRTAPTGRVHLAGSLTIDGNLGIGTGDPGPSALKIFGSATDFADVRFDGAGMGQLEVCGWASGWSINTRTEGKRRFRCVDWAG